MHILLNNLFWNYNLQYLHVVYFQCDHFFSQITKQAPSIGILWNQGYLIIEILLVYIHIFHIFTNFISTGIILKLNTLVAWTGFKTRIFRSINYHSKQQPYSGPLKGIGSCFFYVQVFLHLSFVKYFLCTWLMSCTF